MVFELQYYLKNKSKSRIRKFIRFNFMIWTVFWVY